ncbi:hypothetical protein ACA910_013910 [Epithemia clementina (nom. ined.)]
MTTSQQRPRGLTNQVFNAPNSFVSRRRRRSSIGSTIYQEDDWTSQDGSYHSTTTTADNNEEESSLMGRLRQTEKRIDRQLDSFYKTSNPLSFLDHGDASSHYSNDDADSALYSADLEDLQRELAQADVMLVGSESTTSQGGVGGGGSNEEQEHSIGSISSGASLQASVSSMKKTLKFLPAKPWPKLPLGRMERCSSVPTSLAAETSNTFKDARSSSSSFFSVRSPPLKPSTRRFRPLLRRSSLSNYYDLIRQQQQQQNLHLIEERSCDDVVSISSADSSVLTRESSFSKHHPEEMKGKGNKPLVGSNAYTEVNRLDCIDTQWAIRRSSLSSVPSEVVLNDMLADTLVDLESTSWEDSDSDSAYGSPCVVAKKVSILYSGDMADCEVLSPVVKKKKGFSLLLKTKLWTALWVLVLLTISVGTTLLSVKSIVGLANFKSAPTPFIDSNNSAISPLPQPQRLRFKRNSRMLVVDRRRHVATPRRHETIVISPSSSPKDDDVPPVPSAKSAPSISTNDVNEDKEIRRWSCRVLGRHRCPSIAARRNAIHSSVD